MSIKILDKIVKLNPNDPGKLMDLDNIEGADALKNDIADLGTRTAAIEKAATTQLTGITVEDEHTSLKDISSIKFTNSTVIKNHHDSSQAVVSTNSATPHVSGSGVTASVSDDFRVIDAPDELHFNSVVMEGDSRKVDISPVISFKNQSPDDAQFDNEGNTVSLLDPLRSFSDPNTDLGSVLEIRHNAFEGHHAAGHLSYMSFTEELSNRFHTTNANTAVLWFDDIIATHPDIILDRANKTYGIQENDEKDPNVTGGVPYFVSAQVYLDKPVVGEGEKVTFEIFDKITKAPVTTVSGEKLTITKTYSSGDKYGVLRVQGVVKAKGLIEMQCRLTYTSPDGLVVHDRVKGQSGICIQCLEEESKTSRALLQYEVDTRTSTYIRRRYYGEGYLSAKNEISAMEKGDYTPFPPKTNQIFADSFIWNTPTGCKVINTDDGLVVKSSGVAMSYYGLGVFVKPEDTNHLKANKSDLKVTADVLNKNGAAKLIFFKWTGSPDNINSEVITGFKNADMTTSKGWVEFASVFEPENTDGSFKTLSKTVTVPSDAVAICAMLAPGEKQSPNEITIKDVRMDITEPFTTYTVAAVPMFGPATAAAPISIAPTDEGANADRGLLYTSSSDEDLKY